jgi:hypothetical protein
VKYYLILTLCSIVMFLVVLQVRPDLVNIGFSPRREAEPTTEPPQTPEKKKNPVEASAANRQRRAAEVSYPSAADNPEPNVQKDRVPPSPSPERVVQQRFEQTATVEGDSVSVYATNSLNSRVLTVLKKGDRVQTNVAILDKEGSWSLIRVPDQKILGYVLRENLEQKRPSKLENQ